MKLVYVHGSMPYFENEDSFVRDKIKGVFLELEADFDEVDLGRIHPPFFDGETTRAVDSIIDKIRAGDGIIFAARTNLYAPSAVLMNFLEYLGLPEYSGVLAGKHIMLVLFSKDGGEKTALNLLDGIVSHLGGFIASQIGLQSAHLTDSNEQANEFIGRICEDFYRVVRQKRNFIIPQDFSRQTGELYFVENPLANTTAQKQPIKENFTHEEERDIEELSRLFSKKFGESDDAPSFAGQIQASPPKQNEVPIIHSTETARIRVTSPPTHTNQASKLSSTMRGDVQGSIQAETPPIHAHEVVQIRPPVQAETPPIRINEPVQASPPLKIEPPAAPTPRIKTAKQITQSLPHYFQPQLSAGLRAVIQISIFGEEEFTGFLYIHSTECTYTEGPAPAPDIVIMADSNMWLDVLNGKFTAQKAFMVGGLKVRGDFVLLSKFDNLFKL